MRALIASVSLALLSTLAHAGEACEAKAIDKNGKALAGAAKSSFMKKC
jgi:opacity protein-like surface antigen